MAATIARPTLAAQLLEASRNGQLSYRRRGHAYAISAAGAVERLLDDTDAAAWMEGFEAGHATIKARPAPRPGAQLDSLRAVLNQPTLQNQCKIAILFAMEQRGIGVVEISEQVGRVKAAVTRALSFAGTLSMPMAEALMDAAGGTWDVGVGGFAGDVEADHGGQIAPPGQVHPEPVGLRAGRALAVAAEARLIAVKSDLNADKVRRARYFDVVRGRHEYRLRVEMVLPWLAGLGDAVDPDAVADLMPAA